MPLLLRGLEHILANLDLERQAEIETSSDDAGPSAASGNTGTPVMDAQLIPTVHARLLELPEVVKLVGAINRYASAKFEGFSGSGNDDARISFQRDWEACIFESPLTESGCGHLDGRFFFRHRAKDGVYVGRTTCDVARTVGAARLRQLQNLAEFGERPWINRIAHAGENPVVLGFLVERVVLGILITSGTKFAGPEFDKALDLQKFSGRFPNDAPKWTKKAMIYVPTTYNYAAVDAILAVRPIRSPAQSQKLLEELVGISRHNRPRAPEQHQSRESDDGYNMPQIYTQLPSLSPLPPSLKLKNLAISCNSSLPARIRTPPHQRFIALPQNTAGQCGQR
ncbi:hypothetical protein BGX38DRAFT_52687 [Terfezia claveryi]|nr:hypothetical protein BGX38DRAFT_52687 [Terfezia claveryi]